MHPLPGKRMVSRFLCSSSLFILILVHATGLQVSPISPSRSRSNSQILLATKSSSEQYSVSVSYEGRSCQVLVDASETILSALERSDVSKRLGLPELPSECRRGNCLTCTGRHVDKSRQSNVRRLEDGLAPFISEEVARRGYVLTCSSHVIGDGVKLQLGENHRVWRDMYSNRLQEEDTMLVGRAAMAKTIRQYDESHYEQWEKETKQTLEKTQDQ